ncbi:hypothetical protein Btru_015107 [Bulinus truncatus]|nr:hypothetical protein Btru_015107 [Bulinus truncatus]
MKLAILCGRLCNQSKDNLAKSRDHYESVLQIIDEYKSELSWEGNTFTPEYFKARKKDIIGHAVKSILKQEPGYRRKEDIEKLLIALRNIPAFAEYPLKMQRELCKVGRFESYEEKRVLVLEGHTAHCFYIILSGTVLVTVFDESTGSSNTLVTLDRGMSFGELGIITDSKRQASVCCKTDVELLSITYLEFKEIFMAGGMAEIHDDQCCGTQSSLFSCQTNATVQCDDRVTCADGQYYCLLTQDCQKLSSPCTCAGVAPVSSIRCQNVSVSTDFKLISTVNVTIPRGSTLIHFDLPTDMAVIAEPGDVIGFQTESQDAVKCEDSPSTFWQHPVLWQVTSSWKKSMDVAESKNYQLKNNVTCWLNVMSSRGYKLKLPENLSYLESSRKLHFHF